MRRARIRILREILALYLRGAPVFLRLEQGTTGKPFIVDHRHLCFNVSHARSTMLVAHRAPVAQEVADMLGSGR